MVFFPVTPVPKPKQSKRDSWQPSTSVLRFRAFRDELRVRRIHRIAREDRMGVVFFVPIPKSWPRRRRLEAHLAPCQQRPDVDNYLKALFDAAWPEEDCRAWDVRATKLWVADPVGGILLYEADPIPDRVATFQIAQEDAFDAAALP